MKLTEKAVRAVTGNGKAQKLADGGGLFLYAVYWSAAAAFALRQLARSTGMSAVSAMSSLRE